MSLGTLPTCTPTVTPTNTPGGGTPTNTPTATPTGFTMQDQDDDGLPGSVDNCPQHYNPLQENADTNFVDITPPRPDGQDDATWPNSDGLSFNGVPVPGDACDDDNDNDGLFDWQESGYPPCGAPATPNRTAAVLRDTDGDRVLDGAECALASDPTNAASKPPFILPPDADTDGLPDALDPNDANTDSDGDKLRDGLEFRGYNANPDAIHSDGDGCTDGREVASVNPDTVVNSIDLGIVAAAYGMSSGPNYHVGLDPDKNGVINSVDIGLTAALYGSCP
jgi:hypothetical protein